MPVIFTKDTLRASVEAATGGQMTILYDDKDFHLYGEDTKFNLRILPPFMGQAYILLLSLVA